MSQPEVVHDTFTIERRYTASPARVFAAHADQATKRRWMAEGEGWEVDEFTVEFRVGAREWGRFRFRGGPEIRYDAVYQDIVPDRRIVLAYTMTIGGKCISASLGTTQILPDGSGSRLVYTEQGAYFDGAEMPAQRHEGWRELLEKLDEELRRAP